MPNWCSNRFQCWGDDITPFTDKFEKVGKEIKFSFQVHYPRPKELDITSGTSTDTAIAILKHRAGDSKELQKMMDYEWVKKDNIKTLDELVEKLLLNKENINFEEGKQALSNIEKYGYQDWYDWSIANWSTKWDAYEAEIENLEKGEMEVRFETAWAPPEKWFARICKDYPKLSFELKYEEEGMGFFGRMRSSGKGEYHDRCIDD